MKAILISIQPKGVELIASGKKTIEVRKSCPKLETPFKVYIYETNWCDNTYWKHQHKGRLGKVIGEFVCKGIMQPNDSLKLMAKQSCLAERELIDYSKGKHLYGWRIADLRIYDKPKELSEFFHYCGDDPKCDCCEEHYYSNTECGKEDYCCSIIEGCKPLKRPPQSWCYVEEK